jgi:hypothetical protein
MLMIPQKLEIIRRLESGESCDAIMVTHNTGSSTILYYTEIEGPSTVLHGIKCKCERPSEMTDNETA